VMTSEAEKVRADLGALPFQLEMTPDRPRVDQGRSLSNYRVGDLCPVAFRAEMDFLFHTSTMSVLRDGDKLRSVQLDIDAT